MDWLNYHHLRYFAVVAREGSIARASRLLHVSQPSISSQLQLLERALGEKLLQKHGRGLALTDMGRLVQGYAEQIFGLGRELLDAVADRPTGRPMRVQIGVADSVPRLLAFALLAPLRAGPDPLRLVIRQDKPDRLIPALATYQLDLVVADAGVGALGKHRAFRHRLGESRVAVFAPPRRAAALRRRFPASLQGQAFVLPPDEAELRREFESWTREQELDVEVAAEIEDPALAKAFAGAGHGLLLAPSVMAADLRRLEDLRPVGELPGVVLRYCAISVERRVKHPAVVRLLEAARRGVFA